MIEYFSEFKYAEAEGIPGILRGVLLPYGEKAARRPDVFLPGSFGDVSELDVVANVQHDRRQPLARTGGGGLTLEDTQEALYATLELPATSLGQDVAYQAKRGVLAGFSVECYPMKESREGGLRLIKSAELYGMGVVDRPAFSGAKMTIMADGNGMKGFIPYDVDGVMSDRKAIRKQRIRPGAFKFTLDDPKRDIGLIFGRGQLLASRKSGTLILKDTDQGMYWTMPKFLPFSWSKDAREMLKAGMLAGAAFNFRIPPASVVPRAQTIEPEEGNPGVYRSVINAGILTGLRLVQREFFPGATIVGE